MVSCAAMLVDDRLSASTADKRDEIVPKFIDMTAEYIGQFMKYDPQTGTLTWIKSPSRRVKVGDSVGTYKGSHGPSKVGYKYARLHGMETPAARVAWLLHHGEWPATNIQYKDEDASNLRIENLRLAAFSSVKEMQNGRKIHKMSREAARHYGLRRYYGMSLEQFDAMFAEQDGKCAICNNPETAIFKGRPKEMHVDHDHATGEIRGLLCGCCNAVLGLARDNRDTLIAAARYLDKHSTTPTVVPLKEIQ